MEGSALCLVLCSTLAALVSVIPVLCSLSLRSLRGWVIYGTPLTVGLELNSSSKAQPWFYHLPPKPFSLGFRGLKGHLYFKPPGQCSSECWSNLSVAGGHQGQLWAGLPEAWTIRCALRTRYVQHLSGFVGTSGSFAGLVLPLLKCLVTGILRLIGSSREK